MGDEWSDPMTDPMTLREIGKEVWHEEMNIAELNQWRKVGRSITRLVIQRWQYDAANNAFIKIYDRDSSTIAESDEGEWK
jgi:hypothetical protein